MIDMENRPLTVVMLGASGAVGQATLTALLAGSHDVRVTTLGRRTVEGVAHPRLTQHRVDIHDPKSYSGYLAREQAAICTLGVGQPSKVSRSEFVRVDKEAVLAFAQACKANGVRHFQLLASVGADAQSRSFYLRTKGELQDALRALAFERLSLFQPSMILTPANRYGWTQALTLAVWPHLDFLLRGRWQKLRGIAVEELGRAMANNLFADAKGVAILHWQDFKRLASPGP
jgi:uncharacterized protein YbjT (DUF2867 family)